MSTVALSTSLIIDVLHCVVKEETVVAIDDWDGSPKLLWLFITMVGTRDSENSVALPQSNQILLQIKFKLIFQQKKSVNGWNVSPL